MKYGTALIGEIADIQTGPFGSQLHNSDYVEVGTPIVTVEHLGGYKMTRQNLPCITDEDKARLSKYVLKRGDTVFSRVGSVDRCSFVGVEEDGWLFSGRCLRVRADEKRVDSKFLYYFFNMENTKDLIRNLAVGTTMPSLNTALLSSVPIDLPPLPVQREVGATLAAIDAKVAANTAINHNLEQTARAIFKSWFVEFEPFGGEQPADWTRGKAEDFFDISIGKTPPRKEPEWFTKNLQDIVWVSISDMGSCGVFIADSSEYLTAEAVERFNVKIVPSGTVLLSFKLTVGRVAIADGELTTNEAIAHFKRSDNIATEYLYCYLKDFDYQSLGNTSSIATAVNSKTIKAMPFTMPDNETLKRFHSATSSMFEQIRVNSEDSRRLSAIRDTLLPRLMSGELSVNG
ncbi:specificity protein S [Clostridia bacterium]|nr:specificity protein S [Clostridia bacterium]